RPAAGRQRHPPRLQPVRRARGEPARLLAALRHLHRVRPGRPDRPRDPPLLPFHRRQDRPQPRGAVAVKHTPAFLPALVACAHAPAKQEAGAADLSVQDAVHGVRYALPPSAETWQVSREGTARSVSGVETEVSSFAMARPATALQCREYARSRLAGKKEGEAATAVSTEAPRDQDAADSPTAIWVFTSGAAAAPVRHRRAFYARGADCLVLHVTGPKDDAFAQKTFETATHSFQVLPLPADRQREVDLLAGFGFLERRDPASALDRFEALTSREPDNAK